MDNPYKPLLLTRYWRLRENIKLEGKTNAIDVWDQHPINRFLAEPFFDSLKKWAGQDIPEVPLEYTLQ